MKRRNFVTAATLLWLACLMAAASGTYGAEAAGSLPAAVQSVARRFQLPIDDMGVIVQEIGSPTPLVSINTQIPRNPASSLKILTTLATLEELGPAYTWATDVYVNGQVSNGTLKGDLIIKGYGDPFFVTEEFWKLLQAVRRTGISDIDGNLVIDNSYFQVPPEAPGSFDNRPFHAYNVAPDAFLVNFKAATFHFYPSTTDGTVVIKPEPELPNLRIDNRVQAIGGHCGGFQHGIAMTVPDPATADHVVFEGQYPRACGYFELSRSLLTPQTFAFGVFESLWKQLGGSISGGVRSGQVAPGTRPLVTWSSRPLGEIIRLVNKNSNNVMSRQLLLTLGAELEGAPGTVANGIEAINKFLLDRGLDPSSLHMENGAGLSREERISPRLMADILLHAYSSPYMPEFVSSLSILGLDGTAKNRLRLHREAGHAHLKTGTIDHVSAIAGFVDAQSGRRFVVVGMVNHPNAHLGSGSQLWNALIQWAYTQ